MNDDLNRYPTFQRRLSSADAYVITPEGERLDMLGGLRYLPAIGAVELRSWCPPYDQGRPVEPTLRDLVKTSPLHVHIQGRRAFEVHFEATTWMPMAFDQMDCTSPCAAWEELVLRGARIVPVP